MTVHVQNQIGFGVEFPFAMVAHISKIVRVHLRMFLSTDTTQKSSVAFITLVLNVVVAIFMVFQMTFRGEGLQSIRLEHYTRYTAQIN